MIKFTLIFLSSLYISSNCNLFYGPVNLTLEKAISCRGPKRLNCTDIRLKIVDSRIDYDVLIKEDVFPSKGKITAITNKKEVFTIHSQNPCAHLFIRAIYHKYLNMTDACIIKKGRYVFSMNILEIVASYYKGVHLFGTWTFRTVFYNERCNFDCSLITINFLPMKKNQ